MSLNVFIKKYENIYIDQRCIMFYFCIVSTLTNLLDIFILEKNTGYEIVGYECVSFNPATFKVTNL